MGALDTFSDCSEEGSYFLPNSNSWIQKFEPEKDDILIKQKTVPLFNKLPLAVKENIFSFLIIQEKKVCRQVSKHWARIIDKKLHFDIPPLSDATLPWIVNCRQKIEKLTIEDFSGPTPYNMIFLQAQSVREITILNSWNTTVSTSNLEWLLQQFETLAAVEVNSVPLPPKPPPKFNWRTFLLNLFWVFVLYVADLTNRILTVLRTCPIAIPESLENQEQLLMTEDEEDWGWMPYPKSEFDCVVLGLCDIDYLRINCTHWSVINFISLPRQIKAITLHNPEADLLDRFEDYVNNNPGGNNCLIITGTIN